MPSKAKATAITDHDEIRRWAEERDAKPSCVRNTGDPNDVGILRLDFPGYSGEQSLQEISWDEWFQKFDERGLALLHQETTAAGQKSNFNKIVSRETAHAANEKSQSASSSRSGSTKKPTVIREPSSARATSPGRTSTSTGRSSTSTGRASTGTGRSSTSTGRASTDSARKTASSSSPAAAGKSQARSGKHSAEVRPAQKHHTVTNISRKQEGAKPSPHTRPSRGRAA